MLLFIDNYDSFTYNLVQLFAMLEPNIKVFRNDELDADSLVKIQPSGIIISPGPGRPEGAGISIHAVDYAVREKIPLLGVCLGHQVIASFFGSRVVRAELPVHGEVDEIYHDGSGIFKDCKNPFIATRYHSLIVDETTVYPPLRVTAKNGEGLVMGICVSNFPIYGVQFHPESFLSEEGTKIAGNFLREVRRGESHPGSCKKSRFEQAAE